MKHIVSTLIMCICCAACSTTKEKNEQIQEESIKVDLSKEYKGKKFPNTNYSMTVQRLEDNEDYPIGHIDKLIVDRNKIYILDCNKAKSIFVYNRDGKLLHVIEHKGNAPGEFGRPSDFEVDKKTGNILVMDAGQRKIIFYSPKGEYIKETKYGFFSARFTLNDDNTITMDTGNIPAEESEYYLKKIDQNGNVLSSFFPSNPSAIGITFNPRNPFQRYGSTLFYQPTLSNNIYVLDGEEPKLAYHIDFDKEWPSDEFCESVKDMHPLKIRNVMFEKNYVCFLNCIQTKDVLHVDFYKEKRFSFYYNKHTKQTLLIAMEDESFSFPVAAYDNEFVFVKYKDTGEPVLVFYTVNFDLQ